ncbi:hypothetical protein WJU16_01750 [Chitinophaga pollutisoli]|uniref:Uncharacterized protein n=1 Tax=Chitinophaga pollutisoli TaxID=3133966 RepID=A0ABZ2YPS3_9BACT
MQDPTDLTARWAGFLSKIDERFQETLSQAATILPQLLDYQQFDTVPFANAWSGIESQAKALIAKIEDTWQQSVSTSWETFRDDEETRLADAGEALEPFQERFYQTYYAEQEKGRRVMRQLEKDLRMYEVRTFAEAGKKLAAKARENLSADFRCTQCQAPLPVQEHFYRSYYQACHYCQCTNTFEPGSVARMVEHFAVDPMSEEQALEAYWPYWELLQQWKDQGDDSPAVVTKDAVLQAYTTYIEVFLKARIQMIPVYQERYEADKNAKITWLRKYTLDAN